MSEVYWTPGMKLEDVEKLVITAALKYHQGNKTKTAASLGVSIPTIRTKIECMNITIPDPSEPPRPDEPPRRVREIRVECLACGIRYNTNDDYEGNGVGVKCPHGHAVGIRKVF